jgi:hypothetical protein
MSLPRTVTEILDHHVTLQIECIDRMYLNVYIPSLQTPGGIAWFLRHHKGYRYASSAMLSPMTKTFVSKIERFIEDEALDLVPFKSGERKDDVTQKYLKDFPLDEGVLFVGKAQEKARVSRTTKRRYAKNGASYPWLFDSTAMVKHFYFYCVDKDFGPFFLKFCSYFPFNAKLCINGHEYVKHQLDRKGIAFEALDNGIRWCSNPTGLQRLCDGLSPAKINALLRKWLGKLPHPFAPSDRRAGYRYDLSILQAEFATTHVFDRPLSGRVLFEQIIRENLDIGRPDHVQLVFNRRVTKRTPGRFRTRVITEGVSPSLHIDYKKTRIKQYYKEGRALRTETTINNTYDFAIGKRLHNLPELRRIGFQANRRLLDVERISHDPVIGEEVFQKMQRPVVVGTQRASSLRFGDLRVQALLNAVLLFFFLPKGFSNKDLREQLAPLLGKNPSDMTQGKMTYDLRRLRLHGIIERIPKSHRYRLTKQGLRVAMFCTRVYGRILRPGISTIAPRAPNTNNKHRKLFEAIDSEIQSMCENERLAS